MTVSFIDALKDMQENGATYLVGRIEYRLTVNNELELKDLDDENDFWETDIIGINWLMRQQWTKLTPKKKITFHETVVRWGNGDLEIKWIVKDSDEYRHSKVTLTGQTREIEVDDEN